MLYRLVVEQKNDFYSKISAKFSQLEKACDNYENHKKVKENIAQIESTKQYQVDFSFNKELSEKLGKKSYDVLVNGVRADELLKKDSHLSKALEGLANHKDMKEKGISAESLKSGTIQPLIGTNEIKITRPENRTINAAGKVETQSKQNVQNQKSKDFSL